MSSPLTSRLSLSCLILVLCLPIFPGTIAADEVIRVGAYDNPPKISLDSDGTVTGFHPDLLAIIADRNDWAIEYVPGTWSEGLRRLENGEIDMMPDVGYSQERAEKFYFNNTSVLMDWGMIYSRTGINPVEWADLDEVIVTGMEGDIHLDGENGFRRLADSFGIRTTLLPVSRYSSAFGMIERGTADIAVVNRVFGTINEDSYQINRTPIFFNPISIRFALARDDRAFKRIDGIDLVLDELQGDKDSAYYQLLLKYLVAGDARFHIPFWIYVVFAAATLLVVTLTVFGSLMAREVARRRESEAELAMARDRAETANQAKSTFLANMTHEIRTPMNAVLGYTEILQGDTSLSGKHQDYLKAISRSGEHLLGLINNVLDMSRISAGKIINEPAEFRLTAFRDDMESFFGQMASQKGLKLQVDCSVSPHGTGDMIVADGRKIRQVVINLLGNAYKFTPEGTISLSIDLVAEDHQHFLECRISDDGPGVPESDAQRIFEAFQQGEDESHREGGTGLGLAISVNLAAVMNGQLVLEENLPTGCTFLLRLPVRLGYESAPIPFHNAKPVGLPVHVKPLNLLVADDKATNRNIIKEMLAPLGFNLAFAANGRECIDRFRDEMPTLIIMDIRMPGIDGIEATKMIRQLPGGDSVGIIAVSASTLESDREYILKNGADRFLYKPFRMLELLDMIADLLGFQYEYPEDNRETSPSMETVDTEIRLPEDTRQSLLMACRRGSRNDALEIVESSVPGESLKSRLVEHIRRYEFELVEELLKG